MATIYVDNQPYTVKDGHNLLRACLSLGFDIPYFCWHPAMHSVGACRQCAVKLFKDEKDTRGRIVMSCMTAAADGTRISIDDPEVKEFRRGVIELLMVNHPHDCPVCDEGGECHLQDMTVMTGHDYRRFRFNKRTHRNQDLGPLVNHEMNRCIACYRCVRFYCDYAGGRDFGVFGWHNHVYFGRHEEGTLENEFSGNLVEICPTGVFTDKTLKRHYTRKWDLQTAPSICVHCGLGCNTIPGERYGTLRRIRNRYNHEVNGYFLCDRGRYGYEFVNGAERIRRPLLRVSEGTQASPVEKQAVLRHLAQLMQRPERVIGIGSPRASLEANFALRTLVGPDRFFAGFSPSDFPLVQLILRILQQGSVPSASLRAAGEADAVLVLGEDVTNTAPMLALALRQATFRREIQLAKRLHIYWWDDAAVREAIQQRRGPLYIATPAATKLDEVATQVYRAAPADLARFGFAVAHALEAAVPPVPDLSEDLAAVVERAAEALYQAERPVIVAGTGCRSEALLHAAASAAWALRAAGHDARLSFTTAECNSLGLGLLGGAPLEHACRAVRDGQADTVVILENDLYRRDHAAAVDALLQTAKHVIVLDHTGHPTSLRAEVVLPVATFAESDGTLVNNEGRAQRFYQVFVPEGEVQASWQWLRDLLRAAGRSEAVSWNTVDDVIAAMGEAVPALRPVAEIAPPADFRVVGEKIARQPHRYSGRTAMHANVDVSEPPPPDDPNTPLEFSMEGYQGQPPSALIPRYWAPGWNSVQALSKFQAEVAGPLKGGDPGWHLIEPAGDGTPADIGQVPAEFVATKGEWLAVPLGHIFGSEEWSVRAPGIAQLVPKPYVALSPADAASLNIAEGEEVELTVGDAPWRLPLRYLPSLPRGVVGLPVGLPGAPPTIPEKRVELRKASTPEATSP
jgi:NADH-quinone oxidoreductase subunit G